jgi:hypothetical protein
VSPLGDHLLFWAAGLLAGTLLGWMLERRRVEGTEAADGNTVSLASREPRRAEQVQANRSG